jgi:hypothetical protein
MLRKITLGQFGGSVRKDTNGRRGLGIERTKEMPVHFARVEKLRPKIPSPLDFQQSLRNSIQPKTAAQNPTNYFIGAQNIFGGVAPKVLPMNGRPQLCDAPASKVAVPIVLVID